MWPFPQRYAKIRKTDPTVTEDTESLPIWSTEETRCRWGSTALNGPLHYVILGTIAAVSAAFALGFAILLFKPAPHLSALTHPYRKLNCGNTTAEAKENGCEFDMLSYSWVPKECYDRETAAEFREWVHSLDRESGSWPFFEDDQLTRRIPDEDALAERIHAFTWSTQEEHIGHCTFLARRLHRATEGKFVLPSRAGSLNHTIHCTSAILEKLLSDTSLSDMRSRPSHLGVSLGTCY